tara:strand:- start:924 stop:1280 length:357 start_codon:yes stop_codon:yes gene_type:complete
MMEIIYVILILVFLRFLYKKLHIKTSALNIYRFKKKLIRNKNINTKFTEDFSNRLMSDPGLNIKIEHWEEESELREKADIHRARLSKFGQSKMNGEIIYLGPKGGVYKYTNNGSKKYI